MADRRKCLHSLLVTLRSTLVLVLTTAHKDKGIEQFTDIVGQHGVPIVYQEAVVAGHEVHVIHMESDDGPTAGVGEQRVAQEPRAVLLAAEHGRRDAQRPEVLQDERTVRCWRETAGGLVAGHRHPGREVLRAVPAPRIRVRVGCLRGGVVRLFTWAPRTPAHSRVKSPASA
jgi:hypothetical protein